MDVGLLKQLVQLMAAKRPEHGRSARRQKRVVLKRGAATVSGPMIQYASAAHAPAAHAPALAAGRHCGGRLRMRGWCRSEPDGGTFYAKPTPESKPFVSVGSNVDEETDVCVIEAMKVFKQHQGRDAGDDREDSRRRRADGGVWDGSVSGEALERVVRGPWSAVSCQLLNTLQLTMTADHGTTDHCPLPCSQRFLLPIAVKLLFGSSGPAGNWGFQTAVVYSTAGQGRGVFEAGGPGDLHWEAAPAESYLNIPRIISAAEIADVQAIPPGYGFLAENSHFAEICRSCKIEFIGPPVKAMAASGIRSSARSSPARRRCRRFRGAKARWRTRRTALKVAGRSGIR